MINAKTFVPVIVVYIFQIYTIKHNIANYQVRKLKFRDIAVMHIQFAVEPQYHNSDWQFGMFKQGLSIQGSESLPFVQKPL